MNKRFYGIVALILCASLALAGGKLTDRAKAVPFHDTPVSALDKAKFEPLQSTSRGASISVGTYTTLEGFYDYQSNGGVNQYIRADSATGKIHVIYMMAEDSANTNNSRRVAYALSTNDGATWNNFSNVRVPAGLRAGFPSLDILKGGLGIGSPLIANHNVGGGTDIATWVYVGDSPGAFVELPPLPFQGLLDGGEPIWPFVASGSGGEIVVHSSNTSTPVPDYENYITRTTDLTTWSPWYQVPTTEASGGRYPIQSNGAGRVGTVVRGDTVKLLESTDNGGTWGAPAIVYYPTRAAGSETLGVWVGVDMVYKGDEPIIALNTSRSTDGVSFSFAGSRIEVWSPTLGYKTAVPWDSLLYPSSMVSQVNHLSLGYPAIGISGSSIVIAYQAFMDNDNTVDTSSSGRKFGEIFLVQSTDGGTTWTLPVNVTNTPQLDERYPSISKWNPAGFAYITWQEDTRAGSHAFNDLAPVSRSKLVFYKANLNTIFPANDILGLAVTSPSPANGLREGTGFTPRAAFRNIGLVGQTSIPVTYQILNSAQSVVYTDNQTIASLASTATTEVTFASVPGSLLTNGKYTTRAMALNPGDVTPSNDTTSNSFVVVPVLAVTCDYTENFEDTSPGVGAFGWYSGIVGGSGQSDWERGTPAKPQQLTGPHGGTKCFVTKVTGNYSDGMESFLSPPIFDLSGVTGNVRVEFYHNYVVEPLWDGMWLQYSTNAGATWVTSDHNLASGPTWNTGTSTGWYNANIDSQVVSGAPAPPFWSDSTVLYATHVSGWIKSATILPVGGYSDVRIRFYMSADASANREGWAIDDFNLRVCGGSASVPYNVGWNMISSPVQKAATQDSVRLLFPASVFDYVFGFGATGYYQTRIMANGPGYWGKFNTAGSAALSGISLQSLSAPVSQGWNMIGSMTTTVDTSNVYPSPYGSRASVYFGYSGGYAGTATLEPGKAYWVKSSADGAFLYLPPAAGAPAGKAAASPLAQLNTLTVKDAAGNSTTLYFGGVEKGQLDVAMYEMPPVPPAGAFDARFETAEAGYMVQTHEKGALTGEFPVRMQSAVYPVTVSWNIVSDAGYRLMDGVGNTVFGAKELRGTGSTVIRNNSVNRLVVGIGGEAVPTEYALLQNYPNPFNPSTTIKFALPEPSRVTVEIYNLLGQRVNTLVSEQMGAGYHEVQWNGTTSAGQLVGSGIYFARFNANGSEGKTFSDVRKLMLMK